MHHAHFLVLATAPQPLDLRTAFTALRVEPPRTIFSSCAAKRWRKIGKKLHLNAEK